MTSGVAWPRKKIRQPGSRGDYSIGARTFFARTTTMANDQATVILRHLRKLVAPDAYKQASDRDLLRRFVAGRDEAAFTTLVRRHGPMVLRVCQRVLHQRQDAEDACQATFLVL